MNRNNVEVRLIVKGRPISEYLHNGNTFVEGRSGSNFEIEIINRNPFRVETIISVDGLSVLDGKEASDRSAGYLIDANQTLRVPGWKLDQDTVAAFVFAGQGQAYATQTTGSARNTGVIGVMVYKERPVSYTNYTVRSTGLPTAFPGGCLSSPRVTMDHYSTPGGSWTITPLTSSNSMAVGASTTGVRTSFSPDVAVASAAAHAASVQNLGTGFGEATDFATTSVSFNRGDMLCVAVLYYDNARGLKARGIQIGRPSRVRYNQTPQAFPGMNGGCQPPLGWEG
jgi:hypothetical protein